MKIVALQDWTDALLISSNIPEPDTGEAWWVAANSYTVGAEVIRPNHIKYRNLIAGVDATPPETPGISPARWQAVGMSNRWGALDARIGTYSARATPLEYVLSASSCNTVALLDLENVQTVVLTLKLGGVTQWTTTRTVPELYPPADWYSYFYSPIVRARELVVLDIPAIPGAELHISLQSSSGTVRCGAIGVGFWREVGNVRYGASTGIVDYSRARTDDLGVTSIEARRVVKTHSFEFRIENSAVQAFMSLLGDLTGKASLFIGHDSEQALTGYGFPSGVRTLYASAGETVVSLQVEGLNR